MEQYFADVSLNCTKAMNQKESKALVSIKYKKHQVLTSKTQE